jgi:hypothetical protein
MGRQLKTANVFRVNSAATTQNDSTSSMAKKIIVGVYVAVSVYARGIPALVGLAWCVE